ncbi:hypothetical protein O181_066712 [Austropuccinia psidii MF-1]|uniref:Uncharacterized protein n=1 Tax=Austropuccinia psidii MF-1 TaxID=1389203 RepID=A0A9Q3EZI4_9BASI|nr:hypothetical protein [Austropuccinia psidii MF-1]
MSANLDRGTPMEGEEPSRRGGGNSRSSISLCVLLGGYPSMSQGPTSRLGEAEDEEGEESVEEEESEETEVEAALAGAPEASEVANKSHSNQPLVSQAEPNFLKMMKQMTQSMGKLTVAVAPRENSKVPAFKTPSMKVIKMKSGKLNNLRMRESDHVSFYIADFTSLMSRIGEWGERAYIHVYRRGLASRLLDQLASHPGMFDTLEELMDVTLELDTRYNERQKEKGGNQEKKTPVPVSNTSSRLFFKKASP